MGEANPTYEVESIGRKADNWGETTGTLRLGHWVKITIYRFPDWRQSDVPVGAPPSQALGATYASSLPLAGAGESAKDVHSSRRQGQHQYQPTQVYTLTTQDDVVDPGVGGHPSLVGTVTRVSASKSMGSASGQFSITAKVFGEWAQGGASQKSPDATGPLGDDNSIYKYVDSGDWIEIMSYKSDPRVEGSPLRTLMVGRVDSVSLNISPAYGGRGVSVQIDGRDVGAVYEDTMLYFNPYDPLHSNAEGIDMSSILRDVSGRPHVIVEDLLGLAGSAAAMFGVPPVVPDSGLWTSGGTEVGWSDLVDTHHVYPTRGTVFDPSLLSPAQCTSLWEFTETYGVPELNEIWVDTDPFEVGPANGGGKRSVFLHMHEKPFVNVFEGEDSAWFLMSPVVVSLQEIRSASLHRGHDRINHINLLIELDPVFGYDAFALSPPLANLASIRRFGLKKLDLTLHLHDVSDGDEEEAAVAAGISELRDLVLCWNLLAPYYWEGTIVVQGLRADIRVGQKLVVEGGPTPHLPNGPFTRPGAAYEKSTRGALSGVHTFFVEAVSYSWEAGTSPSCATEIRVSRGYQDDLRLPHIQKLYDRWEDATAITAGPAPEPALATGLAATDTGTDGEVP